MQFQQGGSIYTQLNNSWNRKTCWIRGRRYNGRVVKSWTPPPPFIGLHPITGCHEWQYTRTTYIQNLQINDYFLHICVRRHKNPFALKLHKNYIYTWNFEILTISDKLWWSLCSARKPCSYGFSIDGTTSWSITTHLWIDSIDQCSTYNAKISTKE